MVKILKFRRVKKNILVCGHFVSLPLAIPNELDIKFFNITFSTRKIYLLLNWTNA